MNNVTLIGNVCRDFELRQTQTGTAIASNTIAVKRDRKEADGTYGTDFFDIYCFGNQADFAVKYVRKGDKISIAGSVHVRDYTTRNGTKGRAVEIMVNSIESLTPKAEATEPVEAVSGPTEDSKNLESVDIADDDLPF